ncbi:MAG: hypothetical protein ACFCBW_00025 [Candidatus Competibacterales bacterium]
MKRALLVAFAMLGAAVLLPSISTAQAQQVVARADGQVLTDEMVNTSIAVIEDLLGVRFTVGEKQRIRAMEIATFTKNPLWSQIYLAAFADTGRELRAARSASQREAIRSRDRIQWTTLTMYAYLIEGGRYTPPTDVAGFRAFLQSRIPAVTAAMDADAKRGAAWVLGLSKFGHLPTAEADKVIENIYAAELERQVIRPMEQQMMAQIISTYTGTMGEMNQATYEATMGIVCSVNPNCHEEYRLIYDASGKLVERQFIDGQQTGGN